jgi:hypothetical protein
LQGGFLALMFSFARLHLAQRFIKVMRSAIQPLLVESASFRLLFA